jgi:hypothetical protein
MPYLEETGLGGLEDHNEGELLPKTYLVYRYLELIGLLVKTDYAQTFRETICRQEFMFYLINAYQFFKTSTPMKK